LKITGIKCIQSPTVENGTLSSSYRTLHVKPEEVPQRIALWESNREDNERLRAEVEIKAQREAVVVRLT